MTFTFRPLSIAAMLALSSPALAQTSPGAAQTASGPDRPLNLSLPRSDVPSVNWGRQEVVPAQREVDERPVTENKQGSRRAGGLPYGSGFEARHGSSTGGRGMGRGR